MGNSQTKGYMYQNQPVITGVMDGPLGPIQATAVLVSRHLSGPSSAVPATLRELYDTWCAGEE